MTFLKTFWRESRGILLFIFLMLFYRSAIADWYHVPSASMQPTILIGDRVFVDKLAYDFKIPLTDINLERHAEPMRGDVIVFDSKVSDNRLIKRVIGIPGDRVEMINNQLYVNRRPLIISESESPAPFDFFLNDREFAAYYEELAINNRQHQEKYTIRLNRLKYSESASFEPVIVPKDYLWVMGDNRDNSADSRVIGLVPRSELIGRAENVVISFNKENYYFPRKDRYLVEL